MNENAQAWVELLETTELPQTKFNLHDEKGFCCLGVACLLYNVKNPGKLSLSEAKSHTTDRTCIKYDLCTSYLPLPVLEWLGLNSDAEDDLTELNDAAGLSFKEIAEYIKRHDELFIPNK